MPYFPLFIDLSQRRCLVVGGGEVAARKTAALLRAETPVTVVSPSLGPALRRQYDRGLFVYHARTFEPGDLDGMSLVVAATSDTALNRRIAELCKERKLLVNIADRARLGNVIFPSVIDRSPVQIAIASGGNTPILSRLLRWRLEAMIPRTYGQLSALVGRYRDAVKARIPSLDGRRRFWETVLLGPVAELIFAAQSQRAEHMLKQVLDGNNDRLNTQGEVYLVGAGPGDPDLLTFRALRLLQQADVVVYDRLVSQPILNMVREGAERIYVGKRRSNHALPQEDINTLLVRLAKEGKRVLRLKGGDPYIFGRGGEEIETLVDEGIVFQVVPGITAASGCATYAGIPLTHRDHSQACIFVTGNLKDGSINLNWQMLAHVNQTVVFYMGLQGIRIICDQLMAHGRSAQTPAALIQQGTTENQRLFLGDLSSLPNLVESHDIVAPTLIIIGEVVSLNDKLSWFNPSAKVR